VRSVDAYHIWGAAMTTFPVVEISSMGLLFVDDLVVFDLENPGDAVDPDLRIEIVANWTLLKEKWGDETLKAALAFADDEVVAYEPCDQFIITLTPKGRRLLGGDQ